jgi:ABC-type Na+ efflux pump permease subunit
MDNENSQVKNSITSTITDSYNEYKESIRKQIYRVVGSALDEETREANQKLTEESQKAVEILDQVTVKFTTGGRKEENLKVSIFGNY